MASFTAPTPTGAAAGANDQPAHWGAIYAMALCSFVLVASEVMPVSLLSPIAHTLRLTEGQAGQAIAISGIFAVVTSLSLASVLGKLDRRIVPAGRALLGIAIGGFWSMSAAIAIRLVLSASVPKALARRLSGGHPRIPHQWRTARPCCGSSLRGGAFSWPRCQG